MSYGTPPARNIGPVTPHATRSLGLEMSGAFHAAAENRIVREQLVGIVDELDRAIDARQREVAKVFRQVGGDAADAHEIGGDARTAECVDQVEHQLARLRSDRASV